jgi:pyruvate,water dikinase
VIFRLADIGPAQAGVGGKARGLARARAAGLAVPDAIVLTDAGDDPGAAAALGEPLVVRSSAEVEDGTERAAAGVLASRRDVAFAGLAGAIAAVRASAEGDTARAYAEAHGLRLPLALAVIVQRQVTGVGGTAYSRAFGPDADAVLVESGDTAALVRRAGGPPRGDVPGVDLAAVARAALVAEAALGRPADVEWVQGDALWIVQIRPIVAAAPPAPPPAFAADLARLDPDATWTWDAVHNPEPLSPAQRGLVELVADAAPIRQEVVAGYLYTAPGGARAEPTADIAAAFAGLEADLAAMSDDLEATLAAYRAFYRRYTLVLGPSLARRPREPGSLRSAHADLAPAWDVAVPTFAETPGLLARLPADGPPAPPHEADDVYFARAQAGVRRALLARGLGEDVFWLPLADVRAGRVADVRARASAARREHAALAAFAPPMMILGRAPVWGPPPAADVLRGRGTGGRARGRVVRIDPRHPSPAPAGAVVAVATLTPALALLCRNAAALIAEHGGLLGHAAALARELGIPCVVGCAGANRLRPGDDVWVDADAGLVVPRSPRAVG